MTHMQKLWQDEGGLILSAELVLVMTIGVLSMVVGLNAVASSLNQELNDVAGAFGAIDQSYSYNGYLNPNNFGGVGTLGFGVNCGGHSFVRGSAYFDAADQCDCSEVIEIGSGAKLDGSGGGSEGGSLGSAGSGSAAPSTGSATGTTTVVEPPCTTCD